MINKPGAVIIEGHVQGLANARALGEAGISVYVVDKSNCIASKSKFCKKFFICPDYQTDAFAEFLIKLAVEEQIHGWALIPSNDHAVYTISKNKQSLGRYYKVISPDLEITERIYDKRKLLELALSLDLPCPKTQYFSGIDETPMPGLMFPVITKGRNGLSFYKAIGRKALLASDPEELRSQLSRIAAKYPVEGTFTQELIPFDGKNKTISFTSFCISGEIKSYWMGVKLREHPLRFGTATFAASIFEKKCYDQSLPLLKALNYTGVCEVEYLFDPRDGKYKLIEINARTWLWVGLAVASGINYPLYIYKYLNGQIIDYPSTYTIGLKWRNPFSDLIFTMIAVVKGKISLKSFVDGERGRVINALWDKSDKRPFFRYAILLFSYLKSR